MSNLWGLKIVKNTGRVKAGVIKAPTLQQAIRKAKQKYKDCDIQEFIKLSQ